MRPIDADAFAEFLKDVVKQQKYEDAKIDGLLTVADVIEAVISELDGTSLGGFKNAPTIDAVPVKRGKWEMGVCSVCGGHAPYWPMATTYYESDYCPNCGAKMCEEGEDDD